MGALYAIKQSLGLPQVAIKWILMVVTLAGAIGFVYSCIDCANDTAVSARPV